MKNEKTKIVNFDIITTFIVMFITFTLSITSIFFIIGSGISNIMFPLYAFLSGLVTFKIHYKIKTHEEFKKILINIGIAILILFLTIIIANIFFDTSWDGNTYHKEMIGLMKNGMNPLYNVESGDIWVRHYARGVETFASVIYAFTNNIESGKCLNFLMMIILFGQIYKFLRRKNISKIKSILFSTCVALNPISLIQSTCYYVDGIFANSLFFIILMLLRLTEDKENQKVYFYWLTGITIFCINIKFTSMLICTMFIGIFILYWLYKSLKNKIFIQTFRKCFLNFLCIYIFAIVIVGSSVYIKNFIEFGHPFYPLMGNNTVDIVTDNEPIGLSKYNHIEKFVYTLFSKTYTWYDKKPELKIPFSIYESELESMQYVDTRIGAFGPLYSGLLILSLPIIIYYIIEKIIKKKKESIILILFLAIIILPIPILPVVWQLRYYPQFYLLPILSVYLLLNSKKNIIKTICQNLIISLLIINIGLFIPIVFNKFKESIEINKQLIYLYEQSLNKKLIISIEDCPNAGARYNLLDKNIQYEFLSEKMENGNYMYYRFLYRLEERK